MYAFYKDCGIPNPHIKTILLYQNEILYVQCSCEVEQTFTISDVKNSLLLRDIIVKETDTSLKHISTIYNI